MSFRHIPPENKARAIEMRKAGALYREIMAECDVSKPQLHNWLKEAGLVGTVPYQRKAPGSPRSGTTWGPEAMARHRERMKNRPRKPKSIKAKPKRNGAISPVLQMKIEERLRERQRAVR